MTRKSYKVPEGRQGISAHEADALALGHVRDSADAQAIPQEEEDTGAPTLGVKLFLELLGQKRETIAQRANASAAPPRANGTVLRAHLQFALVEDGELVRRTSELLLFPHRYLFDLKIRLLSVHYRRAQRHLVQTQCRDRERLHHASCEDR